MPEFLLQQETTKMKLANKLKSCVRLVSIAHLAVCQLHSLVQNNSFALQAPHNQHSVLMDTFVRIQLPTLRKRQLCVQLDTSVKQVLLHSVGPVTFVNLVLALLHQLMVQRVTFVHLAISVQPEQLSKLHVMLDITILTKAALTYHSVKFAQQEQLAPTQVHPIQLR
jgi:hypothetical protein